MQADQEIGDQLPRNVAQFCRLFPPGTRLCRIFNRSTGTFLDVRPNLNVVNSHVPQVVCETNFLVIVYSIISCRCFNHPVNPENVGVQYWLITPYDNGQALVPVPKDGELIVRYLTPSTDETEVPLTVSPFPVSWIILPTSRCPEGNPENAYKIPKGIYEQWNCIISWPHFANKAALTYRGNISVPDQQTQLLSRGDYKPDHLWWFWTIQFIRYQQMESITPVLLPNSPLSVLGHRFNVNDNDSEHSDGFRVPRGFV
ncbi:hypothetical protein NP233_g4307 [Leucocoprinus birnbaumii]|uniref:Uncharacterized protein n=1 Tax=Leucocoprinus birnbaumii TaxID=56174 RepID=A0AAD5YSY4_9AGAR|nr:hypothetical protein NP233_g4307 [Leucocoprinus birnbaumii]